MPITMVVFALVGWISIGCVLGNFYNPNIEEHVIVYFIFNTLSTTGIGGIDLGGSPWVFVVFITYTMCGLAIISLFINLLHTKFSKQYWLPGNTYIPLFQRNQVHSANLATVESFDEDLHSYAAEPPIYRYTTIGIFQAEDRCPLIREINKDEAVIDAVTQTQPAQSIEYRRPPSPIGGLPLMPHVNQSESHDDVNSLMIETYPSRPPRMIHSNYKVKSHQPSIGKEQS